jgi:hypothetical protein
MCGEYYSGWFDTWGAPHRRGSANGAVADIQTMLKANGSFSLYMAHGGTSFGLWGGCDRPFRPDTSSYDYDAPISEAGWTGEKFAAYREASSPSASRGNAAACAGAESGHRHRPFALKESCAVSAALPANAIRAGRRCRSSSTTSAGVWCHTASRCLLVLPARWKRPSARPRVGQHRRQASRHDGRATAASVSTCLRAASQ